MDTALAGGGGEGGEMQNLMKIKEREEPVFLAVTQILFAQIPLFVSIVVKLVPRKSQLIP